MALKIIVLLFLALTITKACDLDWILEDIYDDSDSSEDESTEKPANNQNHTSPSTAKPPAPQTPPPPPETTSINTKPAPIIPQVADNAPANNSSREQRRHRTTHHRRRVLRRIPVKDQKTNLNEGRGFKSDEFSVFERLTPFLGKTLVQENTKPTESETGRGFIIELPEGRTDFEQKGKNVESEDFMTVLMGALGRKNTEENDRHEFIPVFDIPTERMENVDVSEDDNVEGQGDMESSMEVDDDNEERSFSDDDDTTLFEIPEGRMETHHARNIKLENRKLMELLISRYERENLQKRHHPSKLRISKSELKKYIKEYLKTLILRDIEGKIDGKDEFVYVPIPKRIWKNHPYELQIPKKRKEPQLLLSVIHREPLHKHREPNLEERIHPSLMEALLYNRKSVKPQHSKNDARESILFIISKGPSKKPEKEPEAESPPKHVMLQNQNPRRPILNPSDLDIHRIVDDSPPEIKFPNINHINQVKEHILRETIKVNPVDNSQVHSVHEQTRLSIIKSPHVPIELTLEKNKPGDLNETSEDDKKPSEDDKKPELSENVNLKPSPLPVMDGPPMNTKIIDFHQKLPMILHEEYHKPQKLLFQELPFVHIDRPFNERFHYNPHITLLHNRFGEGPDAQKPNPADLTKPLTDLKPQTPALAPAEENFYMKPQNSGQNEAQKTQMPLVDMLDKFKGQNGEKPMQEGGALTAAPASSPVKHTVVNAV